MGVISTLVSACSEQFWANALTPRWGYERHADIAYGDQPRQMLDVYVPDERAIGAPVVVFFYGGSWQKGDKAGYRFIGQALASRGLIAVLPNYRLYPPTTFPGFVADGAEAVAWAHSHAVDYGGNAAHLFVSGHSAGAHIAAMLATNGDYLAAAGMSIKDLAGFVGLSGPYDFLPIRDPALQRVFAPESAWPQSQPIRFVDGDEPPMLLLHGEVDRFVLPKNSRNLAARVNQGGGSARLEIYPGVGHAGMLAPLVAPLRWRGDQLDTIAAFIRQHTTASDR